MATSTVASGQESKAFSGLRQVNIRSDLGAIAELIELCFGPTMDEAGRAAVREMRLISRSGPLLTFFYGLDRLLGGLEQGFVWLDEGRLVGNVSLSAARYPRRLGNGYVIANVAVHPDFRRRGIAQALLRASLEHIGQKGGQFAILQVEAQNTGAQALYRKLGFREDRTFIRWHRSAHLRPPRPLPDTPYITLRQANEWQAEYELAQLTRPNSQGGLGWLRPTHPRYFRPSFWRLLEHMVSAQHEERWIIRREYQRGIAASLQAVMRFGGPSRLLLLVHPDYQGKVEEPLLNYALRRLEDRYRSVQIEHPLDDAVTTALLDRLGFERRHTLVHMRHDFA